MAFTDQEYRQLESMVKGAMFEATKDNSGRLDSIDRQLQDGANRMERIEKDLKTNTEATADVREMFDFAQKGLRLMGGIGNALKWLVGVLGPLAGLWALWKGHKQ